MGLRVVELLWILFLEVLFELLYGVFIYVWWLDWLRVWFVMKVV